MRIASIQLELSDRPKAENVERALHLIDKVENASLMLLPEIWSIGYFSFSSYEESAELINGPMVEALQNKANNLETYIFMGSFVEREGNNLYNTSLLIDPSGAVIGRYRKIHLFGYQSKEDRLLKRGETICVVDTAWGRTGISTCYDLRFPELFRKMVDQNAQFFLVASAWPLARLEAWRLFNRARAHENLAYLISCNCAGSNEGTQYAGHSMVVDPLGSVVAEAGEGEEILYAEINPGLVESSRKTFPALNDRIFK